MIDSDDRMDFWWDEDAQQYIAGDRFGPVRKSSTPEKPMQETLRMAEYDGTPRKRSLEDVGTRFQHIADFQDYISDGLIAVVNSLERYVNASDIDRKKVLESTLAMVQAYQKNLAEYDKHKFGLHNTLDENVPSRAVLDAIKADKAAVAAIAKAKQSKAQSENPKPE